MLRSVVDAVQSSGSAAETRRRAAGSWRLYRLLHVFAESSWRWGCSLHGSYPDDGYELLVISSRQAACEYSSNLYACMTIGSRTGQFGYQ